MRGLAERLLAQMSPLEFGLMGLALLLFLLSFRLFRGEADARKARVFRAFNLLVIAFVPGYHLVSPWLGDSWVLRAAAVVAVAYFAHLAILLSAWIVRRRFGRERMVGEQPQVVDTYQSRVLTLVAGTVIGIVALVAIVRILGFTSLLEAGGVLGVIGVMLAITQASWAPDIISGLIILNSSLVEEGDVIQLDDSDLPLVVFKTKLFHTELLNLVNNHRIMMRNADLRARTIHNLTKFASARGLRERLRFRIGYDEPAERVRAFFERVRERAVADPDIGIEPDQPFEVRVLEADDHAVEWGLFYHTKQVRAMLDTRQRMIELILEAAREARLSLATPFTVRLTGWPTDRERAG